MNDDLEQFHARNMASDPQYAVARHLLELGEAVTQLVKTWFIRRFGE